MDFALPPEDEAFRADVRTFLAEHVTDEIIETAHRTGTVHDWGLHRRMAVADQPCAVRRENQMPTSECLSSVPPNQAAAIVPPVSTTVEA